MGKINTVSVVMAGAIRANTTVLEAPTTIQPWQNGKVSLRRDASSIQVALPPKNR